MDTVKFVNKIRNYTIASFLVPLIAINSCLLIYKFLGNMNILMYDNFNWNEVEHTYAYSEYHKYPPMLKAKHIYKLSKIYACIFLDYHR